MKEQIKQSSASQPLARQIPASESHISCGSSASDSGKYYLWMMSVLLTMCVIFIYALFADTETNSWFIKEGGVVETMSAAGYIVCIILMLILGRYSYLKKYWYFPVLLLAFALRELDFDKRFTEVGILKSKFLFSAGDSVLTKITGLAIVLFILFAAGKTILAHGSGFVGRFKHRILTPIDWSAGLGVLFLFISKSLDGLDRKLAGFGIVVSEQSSAVAAHLEESMEWAIPFLFMVGLLIFFSQRRQRYARTMVSES